MDASFIGFSILELMLFGAIYLASFISGYASQIRQVYVLLSLPTTFWFVKNSYEYCMKEYGSIGPAIFQAIFLIAPSLLFYWLIRKNVLMQSKEEIKNKELEELELVRWNALTEEQKNAELKYKEEEKKENNNILLYGLTNKKLICPHCKIQGKVRSQKNSSNELILAPGNVYKNRENVVTQMRCDNCRTRWSV